VQTQQTSAGVDIQMQELLEAGVHFGHQTRRWNPKMKPFIFGKRNGIYIIDLAKTVGLFRDALRFVERLGRENRRLLFVGTKKQAAEVVEQEAQRCGQYWVTHRWLGGTLTNFVTIRQSVERMLDIEARLGDENGGHTKKERLRLERERERMVRNLEGVRNLDQLPDAIFVVDPKAEAIAVAEANKLGIPIVAIVDTNCDPEQIDYVIPGNDDAIRTIRLFTSRIADAYLSGAGLAGQEQMIRDKDAVETSEEGAAEDATAPTEASEEAAASS